MSSDDNTAHNYQPGDTANGHMLGADGQWHRLSDLSEAGAVPAGSVVLPKRTLALVAAGVVGAGLLGMAAVAAAVGGGTGSSAGASASPVAVSSSKAAATSSPAAGGSARPTPTRTTTPTPTVTPTPTRTTPPVPPKEHAALDERTWALIAKDPDAPAGESYLVFGEVTQFDSATGTSAFRANVAAGNTCEYGFFDGDNTILSAGPGVNLANVVADDVFAAQVTVLGSFSYDTTLGGNTTVPRLQVDSIEVQGTCEY